MDEVLSGAFTEEIVTRGSECDASRAIALPMWLEYFEHLRWCWIRHPAFGLVDHVHRGHFFVVRQQVFAMSQGVPQGVPLRLLGVLEKVGRCEATVRHEAWRLDTGEKVLHGRVSGLWLGPDRRLTRIPDETRAAAALHAPVLAALEGSGPWARAREGREGSYFEPPQPVWEALPVEVDLETRPEAVHRHDFVVRPSDEDIFQHVNAATWLKFGDDARAAAVASGALGAWGVGRSIRVGLRYLREAVRGEALRAEVAAVGDGALAVTIVDADDQVRCRLHLDLLG